MQIVETPIQGVVLIEPTVHGDDRGFFFESYNETVFRELGIPTVYPQDNHSSSHKGVLRGLHFQHAPKGMAKIVRVTRGKVWDCVVDLRKGSKTYLQWYGVELSAENKRILYMPEGFAHGFHVLEDCDFLYKCSSVYDKTLDANVRYDDPRFGVDWKLTGVPILSERDRNAPSFDAIEPTLRFFL